jgi:hypothetical protein
MFGGNSDELSLVGARAWAQARRTSAIRMGSEHLLWALADSRHPVADLLSAAGAGAGNIAEAVRAAGPSGAGAAADVALLAGIGVDLQALLPFGRLPVETPPAREPLLPLGARGGRRRCAAMSPPIGLDAQAVCEASLRLALARREREHRPEHLGIALVALDPGVAWVLTHVDVDRAVLLDALAAAYPPPRRNRALRVERHLGRGARARDLVHRYERTTGRTTTYPQALTTLIAS